MAMTCTISLGAATLIASQSTQATLTVSNSGASAVNVLQVSPTANATGALTNDTPPVALGLPFVGPGAVVIVPPSGSIAFSFGVTPLASSGSGTYSIGAVVNCSDGSVISPTAATLTATSIPNA